MSTTTDPILDLLQRFPNCRVTITSGSKPYKKPKVGDTKVVRGITYVRQQKRGYGPGGRFIGYQVRRGRPLYEWVRKEDLSNGL
jgi:hypothetical protein